MATSAGDFTKAETDSEGRLTVHGWSAWDGCEGSMVDQSHPWLYDLTNPPTGTYWIGDSCRWQPFLTLGPGESASDCSTPARDLVGPPDPEVELLWEGSTAWRTEEREQTFELNGVNPQAGGRLLCLATMFTGPDLCSIGALDWVCERAMSEMIVLASLKRQEQPEAEKLLAEDRPEGLEVILPEVPRTVPRKSCRPAKASPRKRGCGRKHSRSKSFSRAKDIPVPRASGVVPYAVAP